MHYLQICPKMMVKSTLHLVACWSSKSHGLTNDFVELKFILKLHSVL